MKRLLLIYLSVMLAVMLSCNTKSVDIKSLEGSWEGSLSVGVMSLRTVFNFKAEGDSLVATLDSPDQGVSGIPVGSVSLEDNELIVSAPAVMGEFVGVVVNDTLISGKWSQGDNTMDLSLSKMVKPFVLVKPQEPVAPFPYKEENVTFHNDKFDIDLAGTLTIPEGEGPYKAVIMITGSGAQDRNEELMGHKPFLVIADYLTRKGIAVLRYDDRGVGESEGDYLSATSVDLATDVEAAFDFLKTHPSINPEYIGLAGHSEGGLIAPITASTNKEVAFIVSLAGPGVNGLDIIKRQGADISKSMGLKDKQIQKSSELNSAIYDEIVKEPDLVKASANAEQMLRTYLKKRLLFDKLVDIQLKATMAQLTPESLVWLRSFFLSNPSEYWTKVTCPVLALNGTTDLQVAADVNLPAIEKALKDGGNENYRIELMPGLNHIFQHSETGNPNDYGKIEETISPEVLSIIADWINNL